MNYSFMFPRYPSAAGGGWRHNTHNRDYLGETEGSQMPMLDVFQREAETIRHFWGSELFSPAVSISPTAVRRQTYFSE